MRVAAPAALATRVRTMMLVVVVLAGLCFSVGEGLRLLPLPYTPAGDGALADTRPLASGLVASQQNRFKPGSLGLPPQALKNQQHKQTLHAPPSGYALPPPPHAARRTRAEWSASGASESAER